MTIVNVHVLLSGHQAGKCSIDDYEHRLERHQCHKTNTNVTKGPFGYIDVFDKMTVNLNGRKRLYEILMDLSINKLSFLNFIAQSVYNIFLIFLCIYFNAPEIEDQEVY